MSTNHQVNLLVEFWMEYHSNEEHATAHGVADVAHFRLTSRVKDVIHHGRNVVVAHFVPTEIPESIGLRVQALVSPGVAIPPHIPQPNVIPSVSQEASYVIIRVSTCTVLLL